MKKTVIAIILGIALLTSFGLVSAVTIYAGDSYSFPSEQFAYYTVTENSSNLIGMNASWENGNTTISFQTNFKPDNFTLIFFNQEEKIIKEYHYSSGGTRKIYIENKTIEYVDVPTLCNQTNNTIINSTCDTHKDLTLEEKGWLGKFWDWICKIFNRIF